jgi:hypothetical protein
MTASVETKPLWLYATPFAAVILRAGVGTPLDAVATREILLRKSTLQVIREMTLPDFWKGFQPNLLKFVTRTPAQFCSVKIASSIAPIDFDPAVRGIFIGVLSNGMEIAVLNGWNSLRTRFIQGEGWRVLNKEGASLLTKGLSSAFAHRALSGAIFWSVYEKLKDKYPSQGAAVSTFSGVVQVISTAPFYIAAIHKQGKGAAREHLHRTIIHIFKTQGIGRLFLPALAPRLAHSALTSAPLMWMMEKLQLIQRKG